MTDVIHEAVTYRLGKLPARPNATRMRFSSYFAREALPVPPLRFGHWGVVDAWGMLGNDRYGDCVLAGAAHETMMWNAETNHVVKFDDAAALSDYSAITGFQKWNPLSDRGTDMEEAAKYRRKTGVIDAEGRRHTVDAYLALSPTSTDELASAAYLFGAVGVGIRMPKGAMGQFNRAEPWDVIPGDGIDGGHYIPCVGRNGAGNFLVVTWGRLHAMTPKFFTTYCDEVLAYVSLEGLDARGLSPEGFDRARLTADLASL